MRISSGNIFQYCSKHGEGMMASSSMAAPTIPLEKLLEEAQQTYTAEFGGTAAVAGIAPGRVNIIGEHTDYNEGFVFPMVSTVWKCS